MAALATIALVFAAPLSVEGRALLTCAVAMAWTRAAGNLGRARSVYFDGSRSVAVDEVTGALSSGSFVAPWLTCIRWRPAGAWHDHALLVLPDMIDPEDFRRLRVLLKLGA